jgi:hypothetical protein
MSDNRIRSLGSPVTVKLGSVNETIYPLVSIPVDFNCPDDKRGRYCGLAERASGPVEVGQRVLASEGSCWLEAVVEEIRSNGLVWMRPDWDTWESIE